MHTFCLGMHVVGLLIFYALIAKDREPSSSTCVDSLSDLVLRAQDIVPPLDFESVLSEKRSLTKVAVAYGTHYQGNPVVIEYASAKKKEVDAQFAKVYRLSRESRPPNWSEQISRLSAEGQYYDEMLQALQSRFPDRPDFPLFPNGYQTYLPIELQEVSSGNQGKKTLVSR